MFLRRRDRHLLFADQLHRLFVHAHDGLSGIVGFFVCFEHFLHVSDELAVGVGRDHPILDLPLRHPVFFSV
jgi:hypothetical protein